MVMITSTPDRDTLSRLDRRPLSFGDASWEADTSTTAVPDAATERWSGGFGDAYDGSPYGRYGDAALPAPPTPEPSRNERIADYWRLYSGSPSAIMSGMTAVGVSVAELAAATGQSQDAVGRYLQAGGASDGFGGWFDPAIAAAAAAAAAAAERRDLIAAYWAANKNDPIEVLKVMGTTGVSVAELAQATGQTVDQVNACLYPALVGPLPPATDVPTQLPAVVLAAAGTTTVTADSATTAPTAITTTTVAADTGSTTTSPPTSDAPSSVPNLVTSAPTSVPSIAEVFNALLSTPAPPKPTDAAFWTLDYADFTGQMETRLSATAAGSKPSQAWSNPNGDGGDMVRLALPNGQSFMVSGGDSYVYGFDAGHGPTPTREVKETESGNTNDYVDDLEQLATRWGLADQYLAADTQVGRDALWDAIAKKDNAVTGMDWSQPYWEISTDLSEVLGQDTSRWHAVLRYQREGDKLVLRGDPSLYFQPSIGHENVMGVLSVVGAALSGFLAPASGGAGAATAGAGEAATGAGFNAALDSHLANVLIEVGGGNALAGYAGTVLSAAVPVTASTAAAASGLAGLGTQLGTALGLGQYAATGGNFLIRVGIQTLANGGDWKSAVLGAVGGGLGGEAVKLLESAGMTGPLFTVLGQATGSILIGQDPMQALLGSGLNEGLTGLTGQIPGFNNLPDVVKNTVVSTMSGLLQSQDISVSLLNTALTAGLDVAVRGVQAGNSTNANTNTGSTINNYANNTNYINTYGAGPVFNVGAFDEATNTWATTMGDGNDGTQGVGNWSGRDYLNGWDVQSDLAPGADAGTTGNESDDTGVVDGGGDTNGTTGAVGSVVAGTDTEPPLKPYVVPLDGEIVNVGFTRNNGDFAPCEARTIVGTLTMVEQPPLIPEALLPQGVKPSDMYAATDRAGNLWYFIDGIEYTPDGPDKPMHSDHFTPAAQGIVDLGLAGLESGAVTPSQYLEASRFLTGVGAAGDPNSLQAPVIDAQSQPSIAASINVSTLANAQTSAYEFWGKVQDDAAGAGSFAAYAFGGTMKTLAGLGYDIADAFVGAYNNPSDVSTGVVKGVVNFGPELFNGAVTGVKISLNGWTLIAERLGTDGATFSGFRDSDPYHMTPLFTYDNKTQAGAALLTNLGLLWAGGKYGDYSIELNTGAPGTLYSNPIPFRLVEPGATVTGVGELSGTRTQISANADASEVRSLVRENQSADLLVQNGFKVEQNPTVSGPKNPDYRINGEIFDNYAPSTSSVRNMASEIEGKVARGQADNIVVNLADSTASLADLTAQLTNYPIPNLKQVIVIDQSGTLTVIKLIGE